MLLFENEIIYNDPLTFSSLIGIQLTQSKLIQNIIKSSKQSSIYKNNGNKNNNQNNSQNIDEQIVKNLKEKATNFVNNLIYLIVTGYTIMIINAISNNNNNHNNIDIIECVSNLCLSHPIINISSKSTVSKQLKQAINKEKNIQLKELKELINDYLINFGKPQFIEMIMT